MDPDAMSQIVSLDVSLLQESEIPAALAVIGRGMRDNPLHVAAYGNNPERREQVQSALIAMSFDFTGVQRHMLAARLPDGTIAGVCGMMAPDDEMPKGLDMLRMLGRLMTIGPRTTIRLMRWLAVWSKHDLEEPHWHLGPVAVDAHLQGHGVGTALMTAFCDQMDAANEIAYLETDKAINVTFYERFGFTVIGEADVIGVPNWFMRRDPQMGD